MALLEILTYPDPRLRQVAQPVQVFDDDLKQLVSDMAETMYHDNGIGLAAVQVNVPKRVIVIDVSETRDQLQVFINPELSVAGETIDSEEGCLSVPDVFETVPRRERVHVQAVDADGKPFERELDGLLGRCLQHEVDHLDGKVIVDYLSRLKQSRIRGRLTKRTVATARAA